MSNELVILASHLRMFNILFQYDDERILTTFGFQFIKETIMRIITLTNNETNCTFMHSFCRRFKHRLYIEFEIRVGDNVFSLSHYDTKVSWRRLKRKIQKEKFSYLPVKY